MKRLLTFLIVFIFCTTNIFCQDIFGFDKYKWKSKNQTYYFSIMTNATKNNPEAYKLMQKANTYNKVAKASFFVGMGGLVVCSIIDLVDESDTQEFDPNNFATAFPETTFSDAAPYVVSLGVALTTFIWHGIAVSNLKKAVVANGNSPKAQLYLDPNRVGVVVTF